MAGRSKQGQGVRQNGKKPTRKRKPLNTLESSSKKMRLSPSIDEMIQSPIFGTVYVYFILIYKLILAITLHNHLIKYKRVHHKIWIRLFPTEKKAQKVSFYFCINN